MCIGSWNDFGLTVALHIVFMRRRCSMPKVTIGRFVLAVSLIYFVDSFSFAQAPGGKAAIHDSQSQITGTWRGNSECVLKNSPCRDEINVYRFSEVAGKPGWFSGVGSKLVNGKEISMGSSGLELRGGKAHIEKRKRRCNISACRRWQQDRGQSHFGGQHCVSPHPPQKRQLTSSSYQRSRLDQLK